jgi:AcrR family transcriptional regulator
MLSACRVNGVTRPLTRAERRQRSQTQILTAARALFVDNGYDRTTIRAVASAAGVDPALVMQHFGTKQELFRQSLAHDETGHAAVPPGRRRPEAAEPEQLIAALFDRYGMKLGDVPESTLVLLRSMLTYPEATRKVRDSLTEQAGRLAADMSGDDRDLRATLAVTTLLGVILGRHVLELDALTATTPEHIMDTLRPFLEALAEAL